MGIEVPQGKSVNLLLDVLTQTTNGSLDHDVEQIRLQPTEQRRADEQQQHDHQDLADCVEIDSGSRHNCHAGHHVGELTLPRSAQSFNSLFLCRPRLELLADDSVEDQVGGVSQDLRSDRGKYDACGHQSEDQDDDRLVGAQATEETFERRAEVHGLLCGIAAAGRADGRRGSRSITHDASCTAS